MFTIAKEFQFSASHQLTGLPEEHPCSRLHGHNYTVIFTLKSKTLNEVGFVKDYRQMDDIKRWVDTLFDHRHLNDVLDFNPTAENMARFLFNKFKMTYPELCSVTVKETDKTTATYER